jgi:hypothetical protein
VNLFESARRNSLSLENHITDFFAAVLELDSDVRRAFADYVLGDYAARHGWSEPEIVDVSTQVSFPGTSCCPDMVLRLSDGHVVGCEHKVEATETISVDLTLPSDERRQLQRYLSLPIDALVYVRASTKSPANAVQGHEKYVRPQRGAHFLWWEFHDILSSGNTVFSQWVMRGFETLGYTPPLEEVGDLDDPDRELRNRNQSEFAKHWRMTRALASSLGWRVGSGGRCELYLMNNESAASPFVWVNPHAGGKPVLLVRATPAAAARLADLERRMREVARESLHPFIVTQQRVPRKDGVVEVIDATIPLQHLLGGTSGGEIEQILLESVGAFLRQMCEPGRDRSAR